MLHYFNRAAVPPQPGPSGGRAELLASVRRVTKCKQNIAGVSLSRQISRNHGTLNHKVRDYSETMVGDLFDLSSPPPHPASPSKSPSLTLAARPSPNKRDCRRKGDFVSQAKPFLFLALIRPRPSWPQRSEFPSPLPWFPRSAARPRRNSTATTSHPLSLLRAAAAAPQQRVRLRLQRSISQSGWASAKCNLTGACLRQIYDAHVSCIPFACSCGVHRACFL